MCWKMYTVWTVCFKKNVNHATVWWFFDELQWTSNFFRRHLHLVLTSGTLPLRRGTRAQRGPLPHAVGPIGPAVATCRVSSEADALLGWQTDWPGQKCCATLKWFLPPQNELHPLLVKICALLMLKSLVRMDENLSHCIRDTHPLFQSLHSASTLQTYHANTVLNTCQ